MALHGNHGRIIPRDRALLHRLYWDENRTLVEICRMFGVTHRSLGKVFEALGIPMRRKGQKLVRGCAQCGKPVHKIRHAGNRALYGTLCKTHWNEHRAALARAERERPDVKAKIKKRLRRWYEEGPINPKGEEQWLRKGKHLLRSAKRLMNPAASRSASAVSARARTSRA